MEVTYTPGAGCLVGAGSRWLLLGTDPGPAVSDELWSLLTGPRVEASRVVDVVEAACGDVALVLVDLTVGAQTSLTRGSGRHLTLDGVHTLTLGDDPGLELRLVGGVVAASVARLRPVAAPAAPTLVGAPAPGAVPAADGLIDGIPPEILSARAPEPTPPPPPVPVQTDEPPGESQRRILERMGSTVRRTASPPSSTVDSDHDGHTTYRPEQSDAALPESGTHLKQATAETVLAVHCPAGHVTAAYSPRCRVCDEPVPEQEPHRMPRPRLGVLHLPDGERVPLDRGAVVGRQPDVVPGGADWPHLVRLPPDSTYVSRSHLSVELDGWLVLATDLGSRGGTTLRVPGRAPQRIRAHERYVWEPGQVLDLADSYEIVYEVTA